MHDKLSSTPKIARLTGEECSAVAELPLELDAAFKSVLEDEVVGGSVTTTVDGVYEDDEENVDVVLVLVGILLLEDVVGIELELVVVVIVVDVVMIREVVELVLGGG